MMNSSSSHSGSGRLPTDGDRPKRRAPRAVGDLLGGALRELGVPSARVTDKLRRAWLAAAEDAWEGHTRLRRLEGGVLEVGVGSAALRDELANFHNDRLLAVLRAALPDVPLIGIRFVTDPADGVGV